MAIVPKLSLVKPKVLERLLVEDDSVLRLETQEVENSVREALDLFNTVAPLDKVYQVVGDGVKKRHVLNGVVTDWVMSISRVDEVEWVTDPDTDQELIDRFRKEQWTQTISVAGDDVLTVDLVTPSQRTLRVLWTTYCLIEDLDGAAATTIPERYTEAFYLYAVSTAAMYVARKAARLQQASFGASQTSFEEVHQRWIDISRRVKQQAEARLGSIRGSVTGTGSTASWPTKTRFGGGTRISHG